MAPAMKAMEKAGSAGLTASAAFSKVAESTELKPKHLDCNWLLHNFKVHKEA